MPTLFYLILKWNTEHLINRNIVALFALPFMASATALNYPLVPVRLIMNRLIAVIRKYKGNSPD